MKIMGALEKSVKSHNANKEKNNIERDWNAQFKYCQESNGRIWLMWKSQRDPNSSITR